MMDQISKAIQEKNLGIKIEGTNTKIQSLLWVDDVPLIMAETKDHGTPRTPSNDTDNKIQIPRLQSNR